MTDTERLNLIEHYGWVVAKLHTVWSVTGVWGFVKDASLRVAIDEALSAQARWALGT